MNLLDKVLQKYGNERIFNVNNHKHATDPVGVAVTLGLDTGRDIGYLDRDFSWFSSSPLGNFGIVTLVSHDYHLSNAFQFMTHLSS
jgi:hypothetical protein